MTKKTCIFTGTRAEYGLLRPLMAAVRDSGSLELQIVASGMHLSPEFGYTVNEIETDGFPVDEKVEMLLSSDTPVGLCKSMGLGLIGLSEALERLRPDILILLGDRFEAFCMAAAAMILRIPICHLHGGEATEGVIDEPIRHSITKMTHVHFTSTEEYRKRVIQLGEAPSTVHNVGAIGVESIHTLKLLPKDELAAAIDFSLERPYFLCTFHPVTLETATADAQFQALLDVLEAHREYGVIFTYANADTEGRIINDMINAHVAAHPDKCVAFTSMGQLRYLSAMKYSTAVIGNSSSGIIEAPSMKVPTIDIGDRQRGRARAKSVVHCEPDRQAIQNAISLALSDEFQTICAEPGLNPYDMPGTSGTIVKILESLDTDQLLKKQFYDIK